jgi:endonuclease YncB( thermonuclease family)
VRTGWLVGATACLSLLACQHDVTASGIKSKDTPEGPLLHAAAGGDGDSWKDTHGVEYRLGLVNTPELSECYGNVASNKRKQLTAAGFRATSYAVDTHKRHVAVVFLADGRNLNLWLARNGYANDRYLNQFRSENRALAAQLDPAFADAKREHLGLWGACGNARALG